MSAKIEEFVKSELEARGFNVDKIEETTTKTPDFYVTHDKEEYLIEVKDKQDHTSMFLNLKEGELNETTLALDDFSTVDNVIRKAKRQIAAEAINESIFRILWFNCSNVHSSATEEQIKAALYGSEILWDKNENGYTGPCYFFKQSRFFTYKDSLDAVVITTIEGDTFKLIICLNPFSPRYNSLKASQLLTVFSNAYLDPHEEDRVNGYIYDGDASRNSKDEVVGYLNEKYNADLIPIKMHYFSASILSK